MKRKKIVIGGGILFFIIGVIVVSQPMLIKAILAKYKSTDHFVTLLEDSRIHYEPPAKDSALVLRDILEEQIESVEEVLEASFSLPIEIFVCASQESFNEYVFLSKNVRGAVYWGKLFLSPGAFSRGSLSELVSHELTHYLFNTHLGEKSHVKNIPIWFREGIAVFVSNGGANYTIGSDVYSLMSEEETRAYLSGEIDFWFNSVSPEDAVTEGGIVNWQLYRVGALFIHYLHDMDPEKFGKLIKLLLEGEEFESSIKLSYDQGINEFLDSFTAQIKTHIKSG